MLAPCLILLEVAFSRHENSLGSSMSITIDRTLLKNMSPANFAFVMATGIVSTIFFMNGWLHLSQLFLFIGLFGYLALICFFTARLVLFGKEILQDLRNIQKMFKYLTFSAGSNTLAVSSLLLGYDEIGWILSVVGISSTLILTYTLFCSFFFHVQASIQAISPFWLLLPIACNSCGIAITTLWNHEVISHTFFLLLAFCFWTFGVFIYVIFMTLNIFRMLFFPFKGQDMDLCYWTCMGAAAIAVVDGCQFILAHHPPLFFNAIKPFMEGMVLFLWGWGTAWIPILCLMVVLKYTYFKLPFQYQTSLWAMVFPMGMYTAANDLLSVSLHLDFLKSLALVWLWIAFLTWCLVAYMSRFNPFTNSTAESSLQ